ncbi:MAG: type II secretion system protein [Verrucomicrobia bacterium]|nr:MAG: type II secretion system protein [Verrucomicrobiota bacterium]
MRAALPYRRRAAAFTMTEIALCIAVIGIAMVAIIGVLPSGLNVQKQNREETLVAQDAQFLIEAVRSGSLGVSDLTNQVDYIRWRRFGAFTGDNFYRGPNYKEALPGAEVPITQAWQVVALLSLPRYETVVVGQKVLVVENIVTAQFRSFTSPFSEKSYRDAGSAPDPTRFTTAFRYQIEVEANTAVTRPPAGVMVPSTSTNLVLALSNQQGRLDETLSDLRLTFQWPVFRVPSGDFRVGANRRTFRTQIFGTRQLLTTNFLGNGRPASRFNGSPLVTNIANLPRF